MIHTAIRVTQDNINNYVSAETDPAMFNVNVALLNIAKTLLKLQNQLDDVQHRLKGLEHQGFAGRPAPFSLVPVGTLPHFNDLRRVLAIFCTKIGVWLRGLQKRERLTDRPGRHATPHDEAAPVSGGRSDTR